LHEPVNTFSELPGCALVESFTDLGQAALVLGLLDSSDGAIISVEHAADRLTWELQRLGQRPVILAGHSFTCYVVDDYMRRKGGWQNHPQIVGTALIAGPFWPPPRQVRSTCRIARAAGSLPGPLASPFCRWLRRRWDTEEVVYDPNRVPTEARAYWSLVHSLARAYDPSRIPGPVLVTVQSRDTRFPAARARRFYGLEPPAQLPRRKKRRIEEIDGDRRSFGWRATEQLSRVLREFARDALLSSKRDS
jgi:hypothetical protein